MIIGLISSLIPKELIDIGDYNLLKIDHKNGFSDSNGFTFEEIIKYYLQDNLEY